MKTKQIVFSLATAFSLSPLAAQAEGKIDCSDIKSVAQEAVAYSMLGAWDSFTNRACFKNEKFKYFNPDLGKPEGEVTDASQFVYFDRKTDKYKVLGIRRQGKYQLFDVEFTIGGKQLKTVYTYLADPEYQATTGICGYVVNWEHSIFRSDCVDRRALREPDRGRSASLKR